MKTLESLRIFDLVNEFITGKSGFVPLDLVKGAGKIFADSQGRDGASLYFLKCFLASYVSEAITDPKNFLAIAVRGVEDRQERMRQAVEVMECAFAYITLYLENLPKEVKWAITGVYNNPPDAEFLERVVKRIVAIKREKKITD